MGGPLDWGTPVYSGQFDWTEAVFDLSGIGGYVHDGCFRADDTGGAINGSHFDFFAGTRAMWKALESIHGTKTYLSLYQGGTKCAYVANLQPGDSGIKVTAYPGGKFGMTDASGVKKYRPGSGPAGAWIGIIIVYFLAGRVRRIAEYTVPDMLEKRYNPAARLFGTLVIIVAYISIAGYQ